MKQSGRSELHVGPIEFGLIFYVLGVVLVAIRLLIISDQRIKILRQATGWTWLP